MKRAELLRTGILTMALAAAGLGAGVVTASAAVITLDVAATMTPSVSPAACLTTCTLGGDIEINNSTGAILSEDVTAAGFSPTVGPFTINNGISSGSGFTQLIILDAAGNDLTLAFSTPTLGSLVGYTGGPLDPSLSTADASSISLAVWHLTSGSLTPQATVPEPASLVLLGTGLVSLAFLRRRKDRLQHLVSSLALGPAVKVCESRINSILENFLE